MIYDWQERTAMLVGEEMLDHFRNSTVAVIGVGGVGGYATESLVRSGIHNIILIDHDIVDITNLNRQIISTSKNIGNDKVEEFTVHSFWWFNTGFNRKCLIA